MERFPVQDRIKKLRRYMEEHKLDLKIPPILNVCRKN